MRERERERERERGLLDHDVVQIIHDSHRTHNINTKLIFSCEHFHLEVFAFEEYYFPSTDQS